MFFYLPIERNDIYLVTLAEPEVACWDQLNLKKKKTSLETLAPLQTQGTVYNVELAQAIRQWLQGVIT